MKYIIVFVVFLLLLFMVLPGETHQKLPPIDSLKELPVTPVSDFTEHEELAAPALPVITRDGVLFFHDHKLKQLYKSHIDNRELTPISRYGEGPREYAGIIDMLIHDDSVYMIDSKQKILCYGLNGEFKWEKRMDASYVKIAAKKGNSFYLERLSLGNEKLIANGLFQWKKGEKSSLVTQLPKRFFRGHSMVGGKIQKNTAVIYVAEPVFTTCSDVLITAASNEYTFEVRDLKGTLKKTITVDAPPPELSKYVKRFGERAGKVVYAVMDIFWESPYIIVIPSYFKDEKPRADFFTLNGELEKSFLMPVIIDGQSRLRFKSRIAAISNGYLLYMDWEEVGFKVYRLNID
jgi:hypothetical protein